MAGEFFTLEAVPARYGDCLLLHYGTAQAPGLLLIDGGPKQVWRPFLEPRLKALRLKRGDDFAIDLVMVSHIDDDHVLGIADFTDAWLAEQSQGNPWPYPAHQFWFNSFERISDQEDIHAVTASITASAGVPSLRDVDLEAHGIEDTHDARAAIHVLASVGNGKHLRDDIVSLGLKSQLNKDFGGIVEPGVAGMVPVELGGGLQLFVVGPLPKQLEDLRKKFAEELPKGTHQALAAYTDTSVPNLSSIVVLAEFHGKKVLLTGDARGDYIIEGLKSQKLLDAVGKLHVDILKMPHHGSDRDVDPSFFDIITADHYVASADGTYSNPDRDTIEMLTERRGKDALYTLHLTYPLAEIDERRKGEWEKDRQSAIKKGKPPGRAWDPQKDSLTALFDAREKAGYKFIVSAPDKAGSSNKVELLAAIPF